jgi:mannosyl-3-phosphoglycerate phosphatase
MRLNRKRDCRPERETKEIILIFTDLDGTLLDHVSYTWDKAKEALNLCKRRHIPVIMVSSKTGAELGVLSRDIGLPYPFISENGGGVFFPRSYLAKAPPGTILAEKWLKWSLGTPYDILVKVLHEIRDELGWPIRGFSDMSAEEISHLTGLDSEGARLASSREYDEPFVVPEQNKSDMDLIHVAAKKRGLMITGGGRFHHLHGKNDKGEAVKKLVSWYKESFDRVYTIALGDSQNDFSMLKQADQPVLVLSQQHFPGIEEQIPGLIITHRPGPEGWNSTVLDILKKN